MVKIRVEDLAQQMGVSAKDILFMLKSIGVDVSGPTPAIDEGTALAIIQGKTLPGPREVIVRESPQARPVKKPSALKRIKVVEKTPRKAEATPVSEGIQTVEPEEEVAKPEVVAEVVEPIPTEMPDAVPVAPGPEREPVPPPSARVQRQIPRPKTRDVRSVAPQPISVGRGRLEDVKPGEAPSSTARPSAPMGGRPGMGGPGGRPGMGGPGGRPGMGGPGGRPGMGGPGGRPGMGGPGGRPGMGGPGGRPGMPPRGRAGSTTPAPIERPEENRYGNKKKVEPSKEKQKGTRRQKPSDALEENVRQYLGAYVKDTYEDIPVVSPDGAEAEGAEGKAHIPTSQRAKRRTEKRQAAGEGVEFKTSRPEGPVYLTEGVTVRELAEKTGALSRDIMKVLLKRGIFATVNQPLEANLAVEIAKDIGVEALVVSFEEELEFQKEEHVGTTVVAKSGRAPVVTVMGHVDHGKTTLLDCIRETNVAAGEAGGITQHIGAYRVVKNGRPIVFLDTPGHEAFTLMRARGAKATDIVVLVVSADDGVMPQTQEAIDHARAAKVPIVVAINKIDKPNANVGRVKQGLAEVGLLVEEFGGDVVSVEVSALKKKGIDQLLDLILITSEMLELKAEGEGEARGVVLEARKEVGRGIVATVLVQAGVLHVGDAFFAGASTGRVRAMTDEKGGRMDEAGPSTPVEVMGFNELPGAGDQIQVVEDEGKAREIAAFRQRKQREESLSKTSRMSLQSLLDKPAAGEEQKRLAVVLKADVQGSLEVLRDMLPKLSTEKVAVEVIHSGVGAVTVNDVLLAVASSAIIVGFNVRPEKKASETAEKEGVEIRLHTIIYEMADEMKKAMTGLLEPTFKDVTKGQAEVRKTFTVPKSGTVAGCMVTDGLIPRTARVRLLRDHRVVFEGRIGSLRRFKEDTAEVKAGYECGIGIAGYGDVKVGDVIEAYVREEIAPVLE